MTFAVEQQPAEKTRILHPSAGAAVDRVLGKAGLHGVPQCGVDDRFVLAGVTLVLMHDLAAIDPVLQHQIEGATGERLATPAAARGARPPLAADAASFELLLQQTHRAEGSIALEDVADGLSLALDWGKLAVAGLVPERRHAAHPHALPL